MTLRLAFIAMMVAACSPPSSQPPPPDSGTPCGSAASTPPNLLADPSFECTGGAGWSAQQGELAVADGGRTGLKAARATTSSTGASQFGIGPVVSNTSGAAYCVHLWVRGTARDMRFEVLATRAGMAQAFSSPVTADWVRAPMSSSLKVQVPAGDTLYLRLRILNGLAGQVLWVDDVDLWESVSGACDER